MNRKPLLLLPLALLALAFPAQAQQNGGGGNAPAARGAAAGDVRIAVANPSRIFQAMRETQDLKETMKQDLVRLKGEEEERKAKVVKLQGQRNELKPETPQWDDANDALLKAAIDLDTWGKTSKARAERNQKRQMKHLFEQIEAAVTEVAERDGFDLVVADQRPELPQNLDEVNFDQLRGLINSRNVLYASAKADISDRVIALLDAKYKGAAAAPAGGTGAGAGSGARKPANPARQGGGGRTGGGGAAPAGEGEQ